MVLLSYCLWRGPLLSAFPHCISSENVDVKIWLSLGDWDCSALSLPRMQRKATLACQLCTWHHEQVTWEIQVTGLLGQSRPSPFWNTFLGTWQPGGRGHLPAPLLPQSCPRAPVAGRLVS